MQTFSAQVHTLRPHDYSLPLSSQKEGGKDKLFPRGLSALATSGLIGLPQLRAARACNRGVQGDIGDNHPASWNQPGHGVEGQGMFYPHQR